MYEMLVGYVGEDGEGGWPATGPLICCMAILMWLLTVGSEYSSMFLTLQALWAVRTENESKIDLDDDGKLAIEAVSRGRKFFLYMVLVIRLVLCVGLTYLGCLWLIYTTSITDLILNAAALEFIMSIDELVFNALAPSRAQLAPHAPTRPSSSTRSA